MKMNQANAIVYLMLCATLALSAFTCGTSPGVRAPVGPQVAPPAVAAPPPQAAASGLQLQLPNKEGSLRFAVIGDSGTGDREAFEVAAELARYHKVFPFKFVLMMGDNLYGGESPRDYERKFERPYKPLLDAGVKFFASLGNHDDPSQRFYKLFNMGGERFYTFTTEESTRFFALDSNYMDREQLAWLEKELAASNSKWKIAFFHHPPYSSGDRHGSDEELRNALEPLFTKYGVSAVFTGHEHFYERIKPQKGIYYFIQGSSAKLREGNISRTALTAKGFDTDYTFMLVEIDGDMMWFQTITRNGKTVDAAGLKRPIHAAEAAKPGSPTPRP